MKRLLTLGLLFGGLLFPTTSVAGGDDVYSAGAASYGARRFTVDIFAFNNAIATAEESIWGGDDAISAGTGPARCFANMNSGTTPTAAAIFMSSDDEADAGEAVTVDALDANWNPVTILVTLGVTNTSSTANVQIGSANLMRINRAYVAGQTAVVGNIYLHLDDTIGTDGLPDTIATDLVAHIAIGANETNMGCYSVPNDYTAFLSYLCVNNDVTTGTGVLDYRIRSSVNGQISRLKLGPVRLATLVTDCQDFSPPMAFAEMTDVEVTGLGGTSESATATFGLVLVKNGASLTGP